MKAKYSILTLFVLTAVLTLSSISTIAQPENRKIRIARIEIYPAYLEEYKTALAEHAKTAVQVEPGVLALQAVYDKAHPAQVTVLRFMQVKKLTRHI